MEQRKVIRAIEPARPVEGVRATWHRFRGGKGFS
jgi:hypothetical protein